MPINGYLVIGALRNYLPHDLRYTAGRVRIFLRPDSNVLGRGRTSGIPAASGLQVPSKLSSLEGTATARIEAAV
jgi:hypothetical protein